MRFLSLLIVLCLFAAMPLFASDGAIPIWEPTTITEPGSYVVTRNIDAPGSSDVAIVVAADNVDLNLNGFTVSAGEDSISAEHIRGLTLHNGIIESEEGVNLQVDDFHVHHLVINAIDGTLGLNGTRGIIEDNVVNTPSGAGIIASGSYITIRNNVSNGGLSAECDSCRVVGNTVAYPGIWVNGRDVSVIDNTALNIYVFGSGCLIERNTISHDLLFHSSSSDNVYRGNIGRGGELNDEGTNNTSGGGNFMPDEM